MKRFYMHFFVNESEVYNGTYCYDWTGQIDREGYALFMGEDWQTKRAMRWIFERVIGPLGELVPDHLCRRVICVNPYHAEAVTQTENKRRGVGWAGQNAQKTHCLRGHEFTPENTYHPSHLPHGRGCKTCRRERQRKYNNCKRGLLT